MTEEKPPVRKALENPAIAFGLGFLIATLFWEYPLVLLGVIIIVGMVVMAFRDRVDFNSLLGFRISRTTKASENPVSPGATKLKPCPDCGSTTKHRKNCPRRKKRDE